MMFPSLSRGAVERQEGQEGKRLKSVKVKCLTGALGREGSGSEQGRQVPLWLQGSSGLTLCDSPQCGSPGPAASSWVAPPAVPSLIKCVLKVRLLVVTMSHL